MKKKKIGDLRLQETGGLNKLVLEKKKELALFMSEVVLQKEKNVRKGRSLRKEIAQALTLLKEREIAGEGNVAKTKEEQEIK